MSLSRKLTRRNLFSIRHSVVYLHSYGGDWQEAGEKLTGVKIEGLKHVKSVQGEMLMKGLKRGGSSLHP
jgi:hypothetical protein